MGVVKKKTHQQTSHPFARSFSSTLSETILQLITYSWCRLSPLFATSILWLSSNERSSKIKILKFCNSLFSSPLSCYHSNITMMVDVSNDDLILSLPCNHHSGKYDFLVCYKKNFSYYESSLFSLVELFLADGSLYTIL